ncbi:hypothetical protein NPX13_g4384 [Xylaria arbuscula]|uniref:Uncharacterized protein n=1 Tax=Xylaria arbuscula TaxID=114810 RepID=A0A9W8NFZ0_9PEZI|nr:hypothetical protein NPX13_g4384 [Xylaria arbuscula]
MGLPRPGFGSTLLILGLILVLMPTKVAAFGAGNIPSIAQVEGHNWRHGDIEDMLKTIAFLHGKKWTTLLVQRTYFGNWLRDYSQAVDVGSLKGVNAETIRVLVWVLSFLANGYATEEFEVTAERLGVYRPEEHIDNPLGYADDKDAREFDRRLRGPVMPEETQIDPHTGMKNYIANDRGNWATSTGYLRFSFERCIHFGRLYTSGSHGRGNEDDLCEALRCLGQALHCMEDFSAHSNYCELALRELGYHNVFPHCGSATEINLQGRRVFPLVTGTFGGVDFLHSVLGEANDHFTQSEVDQLDIALKNSENSSGPSGGGGGSGTRGLSSLLGGGGSGGSDFISLVASLPGIGGGMASEANDLKRMAQDQERRNEQSGMYSNTRSNANIVPGMSENFDPVKVSKQVYPILAFRDKIVKSINRGIAKIPGLESLLEKIGETLTAFVLGLLAPFIRPIIAAVTKALKDGSSGVISASAHSQLEPWTNPHCSDPTHSMLSKDHFTNVLNPCAGRIATTILQYVVPRILYAWENPGVPVQEVINDVCRAFHHPAIRDERVEIQRTMFDTVRNQSAMERTTSNLDRRVAHTVIHMAVVFLTAASSNSWAMGGRKGPCGINVLPGTWKPWVPAPVLAPGPLVVHLQTIPGGQDRVRDMADQHSLTTKAQGVIQDTKARVPQGEAASYFTGSTPNPSHQSAPYPSDPSYGPGPGHSHGYQNQGYGGPPPPHQGPPYHGPPHGGPPPQGGYPPYGQHPPPQQQWGGGYGNPPYPY